MSGKLRLPSLNALRVFHAVAQHKSFRQAADELLVTPQAVGQQIKLLAYNEQTSSPETEQILKAVKDDGVAVVPVTETLPAGKDYLTWMKDNLSAIKSALG